MGASYPQGHIPQDIYEARLKPAEPVKKVKSKPKIIPMPKIMPTKPEAKSRARLPFMKDKPKNIPKLTEAKVKKMKMKEQINLLKELGNYNSKIINTDFKYEKDRIAEIMRLYK